MYQMLDLDYQLDLDEMLNVTSQTEDITHHFEEIADLLNQTSSGFLYQSHLDKLEAMKGKKSEVLSTIVII